MAEGPKITSEPERPVMSWVTSEKCSLERGVRRASRSGWRWFVQERVLTEHEERAPPPGLTLEPPEAPLDSTATWFALSTTPLTSKGPLGLWLAVMKRTHSIPSGELPLY